nr:hypothetical protein B0A51_08360 [Rachicladosporium sp. CCFEE 5018]
MPEEGVLSKLARYEQILRDNNLLPDAESGPRTTVSLQVGIPEASTEGTLVTGEGKSRFIDKYLWRPILEDQDEDTAHLTDDEDNAQPGANLLSPMAADPLTGALTGSMRRVLHIPSVDKVVRRVIDQPQLASKAEEALMFAVYHFATCSSSEDDCVRLFGQPKHTIQNYYHAAVKQALVNAKLLKTTDMMVMQAFILFLLSSRHSIDPSTFWILTGVAVRIAQRMGLHRDGESLGLSPFDVQMRRRLFYQLLPLDGMASQMSGTGISMRPDSWDTKQPVNLNDSDIFPGMTEWPEITPGATDMIFCLARTELGALFAAKALISHGATWRFRDVETVIQLIDEVETSIETKYVRYCDIVEPLHLLVVGLARASTNSSRLRIRVMHARDRKMTQPERRELWQLATKVIRCDCSLYSQQAVRKFRWHINAFFQWDSLIFIIQTLRDADLLLPVEVDAAWDILQSIYGNHPDMFNQTRALHVAACRLTLKAWEASPPSNAAFTGEPDFIVTLRDARQAHATKRAAARNGSLSMAQPPSGGSTIFDPSPESDASALFASIDGLQYDLAPDFTLDQANWTFWDQLISGYQPPPLDETAYK